MEWFYEKGGKQNGPVEVSELTRMLDTGDLGLDTLVWRKGMDDWKPMREADVLKTESGEEMAVCAASGDVKPRSEMVPYGDRWVSPDHREAFVQQLMEGARVEGDGDASDYEVKTGHYLGRAWEIMSADFWPIIGVSALILICYNVATQLPVIGMVAGLVSTPLFAGLSYYLLLKVRGQESHLEDSFSGFRRNFVQLLVLGLIVGVIMLISLVPGIAVVVGGAVATENISEPVGVTIIVFGVILALLPAAYLNTIWMFASLLCIDKQIDFWPAMSTSMKAVNKHWFSCFLFAMVIGVLNIVGMLVFCIGVFFTFPWTILALGCFYEDVFGRRRVNELELSGE